MKRDVFGELARRYRTPREVQKYIQTFEYNRELKGETLRSAAAAIRAGVLHCFEASFVAAAILERHGYEPLIMDFESIDGLDHVVYIFQQKGRWGSISRSRDPGLQGRAPVFRSLRDLTWSYFDPFIDKSGKIKAYQAFHLDEIGVDWRYSEKFLWTLEDHLIDEKHIPLPSSKKRYGRLYKRYKNKGRLPMRPTWW